MTDRRVYVVANVAGITSMASRRLQLSGVPLLGGGGTDIEPGVVHTVRGCRQCSTTMLWPNAVLLVQVCGSLCGR